MDIFTQFANWLAYDLIGLNPAGKLGEGVHFFIEDTAKIFALLAVMIYVISLMRANLPVEKIRDFLVGRHRLIGYFIAALFGALTPFCSCSSIPIFLGFIAAGIPLGITMAFLVTSPMVNEAAVVILGGILGWQLTAIYVAFGIGAGFLGGIFFDAIGAEKWLANSLINSLTGNCCCAGEKKSTAPINENENQNASININATKKITWRERHEFAFGEVKDILRRIGLWVIFGIGIGAFLHGALPDNFIAQHLGDGKWWNVPAAVMIGIPTYASCNSVIPIIGALIQKGLPVGTAFAFMLSTAGASLPEFIMLKKVMAIKLLAVFAAYLLVFFTLCGWTLNYFYKG